MAREDERVVVLGAGMAGLLAAGAAAGSGREVVVVDRDDLPGLDDTPAPRRGIPQGRHAHGLLARGQQVLEELFPGFTADLVAEGVPAGDLGYDARWHVDGRRLATGTSGLTFLCASRPCLEARVRARVAALPGVTVLDATTAEAPIADDRGRRIVGVRIRHRDGRDEIADADLVVDATGRGSRAPGWLEDLGYPRPDSERVSVGLGYASRIYRTPAALAPALAVLYAPGPTRPRGGGLQVLEGDRVMVTLAGVAGDHPPLEPRGFLDFARDLPVVHDVLRDAEPLDEPVGFRFPTPTRRHYARLPAAPEGLIVLGDGLCSLNPIYAQGMTVAGLQALALRQHLGAGPLRTRPLQRALAAVADTPWTMMLGADTALPGVEIPLDRATRAVGAYLARLQAAAVVDPTVAGAFLRVVGLVDPPGSLVRPRVAVPVLRHALSSRRDRTPAAS
ncbi:FAD-dependent oxidoreductase [Actinomycetospora cinnamomea]|uniref:Flavin-dependent dehydrogenase n=1 Tax=Actinomycetospora cinnamomea TaxID=663609 RepID=A0A2U1F2M2_9PSEU|nr:FAD-dependent oxidoreductase [Actinomycetospora cinnamomea]PVZ06416.1 flavin-dependent dehydrogenase [Actinomycetospora cinnamomea]